MKGTSMKRETIFLKAVVCGIGLVVLGLCAVALPLGMLSDNTGYYKPILAGLYVPAIPFLYALYQALLLLGLIDKNKAFSEHSVQALKRIKFCAGIICVLFAAGLPYIYNAAQRDDAPGVFALGLFITGVSLVIATFAAVLQKLMQSGLDLKAENDLTV